jgi:hypothetical protein
MEFFELFELLFKKNIRYLLCGGLAVSIYGIPRSTADIDLLIDFDEENVLNFLSAMKILSYQPNLPIALETLINEKDRSNLIESKNLIAYSFFNSRRNTFSLDILVKSPIPFNELWDRRETKMTGNTPVSLVSIPDLILLKQASGRLQDENDVVLLTKLLKNGKGRV